jgi:hypothetical protein
VPGYAGRVNKLVAIAPLVFARVAAAESDCRAVEVDLLPSDRLQIVAWIEDAQGNYVDTAFITQTTGLHGLGNRVGIMDLHSGPGWPYGAREDVFPIWAHRHGLTWPRVVWQPGAQSCGINTVFARSSSEPFYCRPTQPGELEWDTGTCASPIYTDKGHFDATSVSLYPPRADLLARGSTDSRDIESYADLNPFDAVSQATPAGGTPYHFSWTVPTTLAPGMYAMRVEVSKERDFNASYTEATYPSSQCEFTSFGTPYRGQPSVLYEVPFTIGDVASQATTASYAGFSDLAGTVHAPDVTITTDTPASGASRLELVADGGSLYRVRVSAHPEQDSLAPAAIAEPVITQLDATIVQLEFVAPGDDGNTGTVAGYDIRYRAGDSLDEQTFTSATPIVPVQPLSAGELQRFSIGGLLPGTPYVVGIRAYDNCGHQAPLVVARFETPTAEVPGCGCRTDNPAGLAIVLIPLALRRRKAKRPAR